MMAKMNSSLYLLLNNSNVLGYVDRLEQDFVDGLYIYAEPLSVILITAYSIIFLPALFGNIFVIFIICVNRNTKSVTNLFLLNLAIADLLVTVLCIPLTVAELVYRVWIFGELLCKAAGYFQGVSVGASVLTIMFLSIDRYLVIKHPVKSRQVSTTRHVKFVVVIVWVVSCVIMIPIAVIRHLQSHTFTNGITIAFCIEKWDSTFSRRIFDSFIFVFFYIIPGALVVLSYSATGCHLMSTHRSLQHQDSDGFQRIIAGRRRVAKMLLIIAILFAVSWLPYHAVTLYVDFVKKFDAKHSLAALSCSLMLGHSNSSQNPILYCFMHSDFKRGIVALFKCRKRGALDLQMDQHPYNGTFSRQTSVRRSIYRRGNNAGEET